ncbi:hypothetical protein CWN49_28895 [Klebsiella michiganensis]|uniref:Uncharacterized protein n=1 Tax=Klebsiella michiganensis TaxID=1134687 RepID=A0A2J5PAQ6_9ENTR|nr:hypothetical protein CWN49_28895 [Klebsiella michiganensis]
MSQRQFFFDAQQVKAWCAGGSGTKGMIGNLAAKSLFLQVKEASRPLNVGQCFFRGILHPSINLATDQRPSELPDKLIQVMLDHPVEIDQLAVNIIDDLHLAGFFHEVQRSCAAERLHVAGMCRK